MMAATWIQHILEEVIPNSTDDEKGNDDGYESSNQCLPRLAGFEVICLSHFIIARSPLFGSLHPFEIRLLFSRLLLIG